MVQGSCKTYGIPPLYRDRTGDRIGRSSMPESLKLVAEEPITSADYAMRQILDPLLCRTSLSFLTNLLLEFGKSRSECCTISNVEMFAVF